MYRIIFALVNLLCTSYVVTSKSHVRCTYICYKIPGLRLSNGNTFCPSNVCLVPAFSLRLTRMYTANNTKHYNDKRNTDLLDC